MTDSSRDSFLRERAWNLEEFAAADAVEGEKNMPRKIVITRSALMTVLLVLAGLGVLIVAQQFPEIRREIRIWRM